MSGEAVDGEDGHPLVNTAKENLKNHRFFRSKIYKKTVLQIVDMKNLTEMMFSPSVLRVTIGVERFQHD